MKQHQQAFEMQHQQATREAQNGIPQDIADPSLQKGWNELTPQQRQGQQAKYSPLVWGDLPTMHNAAVSQVTGRPTGATVQEGEQASGEAAGVKFQNLQPNATQSGVDSSGQPIPTNKDEIVNGLKSGDLPYKMLVTMARKNPQMYMGIVAEVRREKPDWTPQTYEAQQKARDSFSGDAKNAQMILNANTLIHHLGALSDAAEQLPQSNIPAVNWVHNNWAAATGGTAPGNFNNIAQAVAEEKSKLMRGGVPDAQAVARETALLTANKSPAQIKGQIAANVALMQGKLQELQNQWDASVGLPRTKPFLAPDAVNILRDKLKVDPKAIDPVSAQAAGAPPATPQKPAQTQPQQGQDPYQLGKKYFDAKGNSAVYLGNGKWQ
jgi:hypothetical protein